MSALLRSGPGAQRLSLPFPSQSRAAVRRRAARAVKDSPSVLQCVQSLSAPWQAINAGSEGPQGMIGGSEGRGQVHGTLLGGKMALRGTGPSKPRRTASTTTFAGPSREAPSGSHPLQGIAPLQDAESPTRDAGSPARDAGSPPGVPGDAEPQRTGRGRRSRRNQQRPGEPQSPGVPGKARPVKTVEGRSDNEPTQGHAGGGLGGVRAAEDAAEAGVGLASEAEGEESSAADFVEVAEIGAPFGVKGWLRAKPITDAPEERLGTPGARSVRYPHLVPRGFADGYDGLWRRFGLTGGVLSIGVVTLG